MGSAVFDSFIQTLWAAEQSASTSSTSDPDLTRPNFVNVVERFYPGQVWGFVVFRTTCYEDEGRWATFRKKWDGMVDRQLERHSGRDGVAEVRAGLKFEWVEDEEGLEGVGIETVAKRYAEMSLRGIGIGSGSDHSICLDVTREAVDSVLDGDGGEGKWGREGTPFVVAVAREVHMGGTGEAEDDREFTGHFNVAVETLIGELFASVGDQSLTPYELGGHLKGHDVWFSTQGAYRGAQ